MLPCLNSNGRVLLFCCSPLSARSTLFPYTTLFRSPLPDCMARWHAAVEQLGEVMATTSLERLGRAPEQEKDRKSTRLNSSHSQTSYAVFCLKKKKLCDDQVAAQRMPGHLRASHDRA